MYFARLNWAKGSFANKKIFLMTGFEQHIFTIVKGVCMKQFIRKTWRGVAYTLVYGIACSFVLSPATMAEDKTINIEALALAMAAEKTVDCSQAPCDVKGLFETIKSIDIENSAPAVGQLTEQFAQGNMVTKTIKLQEAIASSQSILETKHERIQDDQKLRQLNTDLNQCKEALAKGWWFSNKPTNFDESAGQGTPYADITKDFTTWNGAWDTSTLDTKGYLRIIPPQTNPNYVIINGGTTAKGSGIEFYTDDPLAAGTLQASFTTDTTNGNNWNLKSVEGANTITFRPHTYEINTNKNLNLGNVDANGVAGTTTVKVGELTSATALVNVQVEIGKQNSTAGANPGSSTVEIGEMTAASKGTSTVEIGKMPAGAVGPFVLNIGTGTSTADRTVTIGDLASTNKTDLTMLNTILTFEDTGVGPATFDTSITSAPAGTLAASITYQLPPNTDSVGKVLGIITTGATTALGWVDNGAASATRKTYEFLGADVTVAAAEQTVLTSVWAVPAGGDGWYWISTEVDAAIKGLTADGQKTVNVYKNSVLPGNLLFSTAIVLPNISASNNVFDTRVIPVSGLASLAATDKIVVTYSGGNNAKKDVLKANWTKLSAFFVASV